MSSARRWPKNTLLFWEVFSHLWDRGGRAPPGEPACPGPEDSRQSVPNRTAVLPRFCKPAATSVRRDREIHPNGLRKTRIVKYVKYLIVNEQKASVSCAGQVH